MSRPQTALLPGPSARSDVTSRRVIRGRRARIVVAAALAAASLLIAVIHRPAIAAPDREVLTYTELTSPDDGDVSIVDNDAFLPAGNAGPAEHTLEGTLTVPRGAMQMSPAGFASYRYFPGFSVDFFTHDDYLVPVDRGIILSPGNWSLILSPGLLWSEPGDDGMTRASFPFTLGSPPDRQYTGGEAHNGVATFLFDESGTSSMRLQVTQETAPDGDLFDMWGRLPIEYRPGGVEHLEDLRADFAAEMTDRMPIRPWSDLEEAYDAASLEMLTEGLPPETVSAAGLVFDETIYLQPSRTRHGPYPFPGFMQHAGMSVSKSVGAGIAMLWLAKGYGEEVFDLCIVDYLDVTADHDGWADVTFSDVLDMATGVGDNAPEWRPFAPYANETGPNYRRFYLAPTTQGKLDAAFASANYSWGPGELLRYTSAQTFVLAAAMDSFLKTEEGPDADLWERLTDGVFHPIGIHHMTMMHVEDGDGAGVPLMASGLRLTVDDLGKITTLLQNGGSHDGRQLLNADRLSDALYRTGTVAGLPSGKTFADGDQAYHASFWSLPHQSESGEYFQVPFMSGAGGNTIFLAPNGVSTFVLTDFGVDTYSLNSAAVTESIRPYPPDGLDSVTLIPPSPIETAVRIVVVLFGLGIVVTIAWLVVRRRRSRSAAPRGESHDAESEAAGR